MTSRDHAGDDAVSENPRSLPDHGSEPIFPSQGMPGWQHSPCDGWSWPKLHLLHQRAGDAKAVRGPTPGHIYGQRGGPLPAGVGGSALNPIYEKLLAFDLMMDWHPLPCVAQLLWYRLLIRASNKPFKANNRMVSNFLGCTEKTMVAARRALIDAGLLLYIPGRRGKPGVYMLMEVPPMPSSEEN